MSPINRHFPRPAESDPYVFVLVFTSCIIWQHYFVCACIIQQHYFVCACIIQQHYRVCACNTSSIIWQHYFVCACIIEQHYRVCACIIQQHYFVCACIIQQHYRLCACNTSSIIWQQYRVCAGILWHLLWLCWICLSLPGTCWRFSKDKGGFDRSGKLFFSPRKHQSRTMDQVCKAQKLR